MKKSFAFILFVAVFSMLAAVQAHADDAAHFAAMDSNNDELVNWQEFKAQHPTAVMVMFNALDRNHNAYIEKIEWTSPQLDPNVQVTPFGTFPKD